MKQTDQQGEKKQRDKSRQRTDREFWPRARLNYQKQV
jgi:hypothetical protein